MKRRGRKERDRRKKKTRKRRYKSYVERFNPILQAGATLLRFADMINTRNDSVASAPFLLLLLGPPRPFELITSGGRTL